MDLLLILYEKTHEALQSAIAMTSKAFKQRGMVPLVETYDVANLFFSAMPAEAYALLTSKPDERDRIAQLMAEKGDTLRGIEAWGKERE